MNESGRSVQPAVKFFKVEPESLLVVHDEVDLELGRLQARLGGGLAGHNGLRSVAKFLGTPEFTRLRIGVGRPERGDPRPVRRLRAHALYGRRRRGRPGGALRRRGRDAPARWSGPGPARLQLAALGFEQAEPAVPPVAMDQPVLHVLAAELAESERLRAFVDDLRRRASPSRCSRSSSPRPPGRARGRSSCLLPRTPTRVTPPRRRRGSWVRTVGLFASRGVGWDSGLEPPAPPRRRARSGARDARAGGGIVCASALGFAEGLPPRASVRHRPSPGRRRAGHRRARASRSRSPATPASSGSRSAARSPCAAGSSTSSRRPGASRCESSSSATRWSRSVRSRHSRSALFVALDEAVDAARRRSGASTRSSRRFWTTRRASFDPAGRPRHAAAAAGSRVAAERGPRGLAGRAGSGDPARRRDRARPASRRAAARLRGAASSRRRAGNRRGGARPERVRAGRQPRRRHVRPPRRSTAPAGAPPQGRGRPARSGRAASARPRAPLRGLAGPARLRLARARARRSSRTPRSSASGRRARTPAWARRCRALPTCGAATTSSTRTTASDGCVGFETKTVAGVTRDYLFLDFQGDDRLYVPHEQIGQGLALRRRRRRGPGALEARRQGVAARQDARARRRARAGRRAARALRAAAAAPGERVRASTTTSLEQLEATFPYDGDADQRRAIEEVKEDLETPRPMDRLVCGDVGFGKTEVAMRAAFRVAVGGQAGRACSCRRRSSRSSTATPSASASRLPGQRSRCSRASGRPAGREADPRATAARARSTSSIGTHRMLSRDVRFKDLGLVVVDEEQRFGVAHKERLRKLRLEVDVLTLTATPIPRTLHMSLVGPARHLASSRRRRTDRRAMRTHVGEYDEELIAQALVRELARGGQVVLPPQPRRGDRRARPSRCSSSCPRLRVARRPRADARSAQLEERMLDFLRGDVDVLVATTIIESGPRHPAGEHADRRPRRRASASRSSTSSAAASAAATCTAHGYLFYPAARGADRRGARAARGARATTPSSAPASRSRCTTSRSAAPGNLLGAEQSGHVAAVGFELYMELLAEAVAELAGTRRPVTRPVPRRGAGGRVRPRRLRRRGGAEDRPAPPARARRVRGRAARAARGDRGPVRPRPRPRREPVRDPGGEAEARPDSARTTSCCRGRKGDDRRARSRLRRASRAATDRRHRRVLVRATKRCPSGATVYLPALALVDAILDLRFAA